MEDLRVDVALEELMAAVAAAIDVGLDVTELEDRVLARLAQTTGASL